MGFLAVSKKYREMNTKALCDAVSCELGPPMGFVPVGECCLVSSQGWISIQAIGD